MEFGWGGRGDGGAGEASDPAGRPSCLAHCLSESVVLTVSSSDAAGAFIITKGEKGASVVVQDGAGSSLNEIPAVKVEAVDTNGAGDVFATSYMLEEALGTAAPGEVSQASARGRCRKGAWD